MSIPHYTLWSIWKYLPPLQLLFCLALFLVSIYALFSATLTMVRLRSLTNQRQADDVSSVQRSLATLHVRSANLHELIDATFYLFGFVFFLTLPFAFNLLGDSSTPGWVLIADNLSIQFTLASDIFLVFLFLHGVKWFVSSRVNASSLRLNARNIS